jgi:hypothetical protein
MGYCEFSHGDEAEVKHWPPSWLQKMTQRKQIARQGHKGNVIFRTRTSGRWVVVLKFDDGKSVAFDSQELELTGY